MFAQCAHVSLSCKYVHLVCSCKDSQKDSTRIRSDKRVDVVHATRRRKCILSLDTINTEASKLRGKGGCLGITLARLYSSRKIERAFNAPFLTSTSFL